MARDDRLMEQERALRIRARETHQPMKIRNCVSSATCPQQWYALDKDDRQPDSRLCRTCSQRVHLCVTDEELRARVGAGQRVVIYRELGPTIDPAFVEDPLSGASLGAPRRRWLHLRRDGWNEKPSRDL